MQKCKNFNSSACMYYYVMNALLFIRRNYLRVVKRKLDNDPLVTNDHVVEAAAFRNKVCLYHRHLDGCKCHYYFCQVNQALNPVEEAPFWFQVYAAQQAAQQAQQAQQLAALAAQQAAQFAVLNRKIDDSIYNNIAIANNINSLQAEHSIRPLRNHNSELPPNFPATKRALFALNGLECIPLLNFYNLPIGGPVGEKRKRLADHIGLVE